MSELQEPVRKVSVGQIVHLMPSKLWPGAFAIENGPLAALVTAVTAEGAPRAFCIFLVNFPCIGLNAEILSYDQDEKRPGTWHFPEPFLEETAATFDLPRLAL